MSDALYQESIMHAAATATGKGRLDNADGSATADNPLCGDRVTIDVTMDASGRLVDLGHVVRGCLLCEASASLIAEAATGASAKELHDVARAVRDLLEKDTSCQRAALRGRANAFSIFAPVIAHKSRHECVLLPFAALEKALEVANEN